MDEAAVLASKDSLQATEVEYVSNLEDSVELQPDSYEQSQSEDVLSEATMTATVAEAFHVMASPKEEFPTEEAATSLDIAAEQEPDVEAMLTTTPLHEQIPVSEEIILSENILEIELPEEQHAEVQETLAELSAEITRIPPVDICETIEEVPQKVAVEETVLLEKTLTTDGEAVAEMTIISTPGEQEEHLDVATFNDDVSMINEVVEEQAVVSEISSDVDSSLAVKTEVKIEMAVEQPLKQASVDEEVHLVDSMEPLVTEPTSEEVHPTEVAYENILQKERIAVETVKTEECAAELFIQKPTLPEEAKIEGFISLPKEEEKIEPMQPLILEECNPEQSTESLVSERLTEEIHPAEVVYDEILTNESTAYETVKTLECVADLTLQQSFPPEEAVTESVIPVPKEEDRIEILQPQSVEESLPEESTEGLVSEPTLEEIHPTKVSYDAVLPKEHIACDTVKTEECMAEISIQQPSLPEEAETESLISLPKEVEKVELLQPQLIEESNPEDFIETLDTGFMAQEMHHTEVAYDEILPKESIAYEMIKIEECITGLSIQQPSLQEAETEGLISLPKEEERVELLQPLSVEESNAEHSVEPLDSEPRMEEVHPTEVPYDEILPKESIVCEMVKTEECAAELFIQQPTLPEEAETESLISLSEVELLQSQSVEESCPEESTGNLVSEIAEETHPNEAAYDAILPKESIEIGNVKTQECVAELSLQQSAPPETTESEISLSIPKEEEEKALSLELESAVPEISASLDMIQSATVEETIIEHSGDIHKPVEVKQLVEVEVPRPEVTEDVSLTIAKQPTPEDLQVEDSLTIPSLKHEEEKESAILDSRKLLEPEVAEESLSITTPKSPAESDESVSLTLQQPEEESDADLTLKLKKSKDGMTP